MGVSRGLRVLVLADSRAYHTERYVEAMARQECEVHLASLERGEVKHVPLPRRGPIRSLHYSLAGLDVRRLVAELEPDVVNPHFASGYGFTAALGLVGTTPPIFLHLWGSDILVVPEKSRLHRLKTQRALARADAVTADSRHLFNAARRLYPSLRGEIIPWGFEREFLDLHKSSYALTVPLRLIVPRRHEPIYNNMFLLRALATLLNEGAIRLTVPNFGTLLEDFRRNAESMGVNDHIAYYDPLPRAEFLQLMAEHDCYLSSARSDSSPASLIEAMALGLVPITADIPGVREWMTAETGFVYEPYVGDSLRQVIRRLLTRADDLAPLRRHNLERVRQEAIFEDNIASMIAIMQSLVTDPSR